MSRNTSAIPQGSLFDPLLQASGGSKWTRPRTQALDMRLEVWLAHSTAAILIGPRMEPAETHGNRALIHLSKIGREVAASLSRLTKLFGFPPREASLARLLARGRTVTDAAGELGISEQTARAYLRQIFPKSEVTLQAELVRRIQDSFTEIE